MKKLFAIAAVLLSVSLTQSVSAQRVPAGKPSAPQTQVFKASEVGKWEVIDMTSTSMSADEAAQSKAMLEMAKMTWEFKPDGKIAMSAMGQAQEVTYVRTGNIVEVTDGTTGKKEKMEITNLTDELMVFKSEEEDETMTITMKRAKATE